MKMKLDVAAIRTRPQSDRPEKRYDGGGLYLLVRPKFDEKGRDISARLWRMDFRRPEDKKPDTLSFGSYTDVTLDDARAKRDAARALLAKGINPKEHMKEVERAKAVTAEAVLFQAVVDSWLIEVAPHIKAKTLASLKRDLVVLTTAFGKRAIETIETPEMDGLLTSIYAKGHHAKTRSVRATAARIWGYAISKGLCKYDIVAPINKKDRFRVTTKHREAITDRLNGLGLARTETLVGQLLRDISGVRAQLRSRLAAEMLALTMVRPHNIREMRWSQIDTAISVWFLDGVDMKMKKPHKVPLSKQALAILDQMRPLTGNQEYVFGSHGKPLSIHSINRVLNAAGYEGKHCAHGFRAMASSLLNEWGTYSSKLIELALAHEVGGVEGTYDRSQQWQQRVELMQHYADQLDRMRGDTNVIQLPVAA